MKPRNFPGRKSLRGFNALCRMSAGPHAQRDAEIGTLTDRLSGFALSNYVRDIRLRVGREKRTLTGAPT